MLFYPNDTLCEEDDALTPDEEQWWLLRTYVEIQSFIQSPLKSSFITQLRRHNFIHEILQGWKAFHCLLKSKGIEKSLVLNKNINLQRPEEQNSYTIILVFCIQICINDDININDDDLQCLSVSVCLLI